MADYYLLFLYLWEDSPNVKNIKYHPSRPSCRVRTHEEVSKGFFLSEFFKTIYHPLSFVFIPFVSISVHSWFQTVLFPSFPLCLCASVANLSNFSIRANSCSSVVSNLGFLNALHAGIRSGSAIRTVSGNVTFCSGAKSNQKGRRSDAAAAWLVLLDKSVHATCGWASYPSSAASITLGLVPRSVCRCFFNLLFIRVHSIRVHSVLIRGFKPRVFSMHSMREFAVDLRYGPYQGMLLFAAAQKVTKKAAAQTPRRLGWCCWINQCMLPADGPPTRPRPHHTRSASCLALFVDAFLILFSFVFIPFVSIRVNSWFQTVLFPSFPLCLCASVAIFNRIIRAYKFASIRIHSWFQTFHIPSSLRVSVPLWPSLSFRGIT